LNSLLLLCPHRALPEKFFNFEYDCVKPQEEKAEEIVYEILLVVIFVTDLLRCAGGLA